MSKRNRIAILSDQFPPAWGGGVASVHGHLYAWLKEGGADVRGFAYYDETTPEQAAAAGYSDITRAVLEKKRIRLIKRLNSAFFRLVDPGTLAYQTQDVALRALGARRLTQALAEYGPDIIVLPDHGSPLLGLKRPKGAKILLFMHHNPSRFLDLEIGADLSRRDVGIASWIEQRVLARVDHALPSCGFMEGLFRERRRFSGPITRMGTMIRDSFFNAIQPLDPRPELGLTDGEPLVYVPAGGNRFKGAALVPSILRELDRAAAGRIGFFVSGDVPPEQRQRLEGLRIHAPGAIAGTAVVARVKACSFGVFPTLIENYSVALLEAANCGVPMCVFDVGGNKEIVRDGVTGRVVGYEDVEALTKASLGLLTDPVRLERFRANCNADARERLAEPAVAPAWRALLGL